MFMAGIGAAEQGCHFFLNGGLILAPPSPKLDQHYDGIQMIPSHKRK